MSIPTDPRDSPEPQNVGADKVRPPKESQAERALRYEAQLIVKRYGKRLEEALEIAKHVLAEKARANQRAKSAKRAEQRVRAERSHDRSKRGDNLYPMRGPALQGGLPGLGKRK